MPNRDDPRSLGGPGYGGEQPRGDRPEPGGRAPGGAEGRSFNDPQFRAQDARLRSELSQYERERRRVRNEFGHDQNYRPGYHEGGTRFGFFHDFDNRRPQTDHEFDPDYLSWRDQQLAKHDRDYADWRREQQRKYDDDYWKFRSERRDDFHQRFQDWRAQREAAAVAEAREPDDKL